MKKAFTMIELIMVIVIISIIAQSVNFNFITDADQVDIERNEMLQDINYLKQLNLNQSFFLGNNANWINQSDCLVLNTKNQYELSNNGIVLAGQNNDGLNFTKNTKSIISIKDTLGTPISTICFDNLGRPYNTNLATANIMQNDIIITLSTKNNDYSQSITINAITGYVQ